MMHWRASRLLASLPDDTLPQDVELELEVHVASCAKCRGRLRDHELAEELLLRMPEKLLPLEWSSNDYQRLQQAASWSSEPDLPDPERWRLPMLSLVSAVALLTIALMAGRYSPFFQHTSTPMTIAMYAPDVAHISSQIH